MEVNTWIIGEEERQGGGVMREIKDKRKRRKVRIRGRDRDREKEGKSRWKRKGVERKKEDI